MKKIILLCCIVFSSLLLFSTGKIIQSKIDNTDPNSFVEKDIFTLKSISSENIDFEKYVSDYTLIDVSKNDLASIISEDNQAIKIEIPYKGNLLHLKLIKSNFVNENTLFTTQNKKDEDKENSNYKLGAYYMGVVENEPNSFVAISFFENDIIGTIAMQNGNIVIGKSILKHFDSNEYIIYDDKNLKIKNETSCGADEANARAPFSQYLPNKKTRTITTKCVKFYYEMDYYTYQSFGNNVTNATNYATGLFNMVATLYLSDSMSIGLNQVNVWTSVDPYAAETNTYDALVAFGNNLSGGFNGDLAHLLSTRGLGGGIAWINVLCQTAYYRTGVSASLTTNLTPLPTYSWNTMVVSHECGHNVTSPHTHACSWNGNNTRIDNCGGNAGYTEGNCVSSPPNPVGGGTIMSYCHLIGGIGINLSLGFGPQPGTIMRAAINNAACLTECENCPGNITITGSYNTALTESNTWIKSSGQTTIVNTAQVKLDPNPLTGYALFAPANNNDFFVASPANNNSYFVSQAVDGCSGLSPQKPNGNEDEQNNFSDISANEFIVYPNPTNENITLLNNGLQNEMVSIQVISMDGKILIQENNILFNLKYELNLKNVSTGLYFVKMISNNDMQTIKFQKF